MKQKKPEKPMPSLHEKPLVGCLTPQFHAARMWGHTAPIMSGWGFRSPTHSSSGESKEGKLFRTMETLSSVCIQFHCAWYGLRVRNSAIDWNTSSPWLWRKYAPLKRRSTSTRLHGAASQNFVIFLVQFPSKHYISPATHVPIVL
jgi:hypothetical protein